MMETLDPPGLEHPNGDQDFECPGPNNEICLKGRAHNIKTIATAYGWRAVCNKHRRVWTWVRPPADNPDYDGLLEEKYADGGMIGNG